MDLYLFQYHALQIQLLNDWTTRITDEKHRGIDWDYVILRKLLRFNDLLSQGRSVKESALLAGFNNYSNFYRLYKKHMGIAPTEYKQQLKSKKGSLT